MTAIPMTLIILDGFGHRQEKTHNAIQQAYTPNLDHYFAKYASTFISGSGSDVGLPDGQMGNSEVGHLNIGAGRMVPQDLTRVDMEIASGTFFKNAVLNSAMQSVKTNDKALHVLGLLSPGGVHSHERHILAMFDSAQQQGMNKIYFHAFLDGRDTPPQSALAAIENIETQGIATIASMIGRYYAMDRDNRWERVQCAYDLLTNGDANFHCQTAAEALTLAYERGETDEFVQASSIHPTKSSAVTIQDGDAIVFMNFRADRARELSFAFRDKNFTGFKRKKIPALSHFVTLTEYQKDLDVEVAYPKIELKNTLGEYVSKLGLKQLRIAETEKYAHVTFFFNGGIETPFENEDRELIPSPDVATYDLQPEMSAPELTNKLVAAIDSQKYDLIICNYANPDMVGHTGNMAAAIKAIEVIDACLGRVITALKKVGGEAIITADHGNAELMFNETTGQAHTAHTSEPVPILYIGRKVCIAKTNGTLADIAPTLLHLMELKQPNEMTGSTVFL